MEKLFRKYIGKLFQYNSEKQDLKMHHSTIIKETV